MHQDIHEDITTPRNHPTQARLRLPRAARAAAGAAALPLGLAVTAGCVVAVRPAPVGVVYAEPAEVVVADAPPAPIVEAVGVAPGPGYFWIGGYYHWYGNRWGWVRGHYELPAAPRRRLGRPALRGPRRPQGLRPRVLALG